MYKITLVFFSVWFVSSCSSIAKFEPKKVDGDIDNLVYLSSPIKNVNTNSAMLANAHYIYKDDISKNPIKDGYHFVCKNYKYKVITRLQETIVSFDKDVVLEKKRAISCTIKNDLLAILFDDNSFYLKDLDLGNILFESLENKVKSIWNNTAAPIIDENFIIFPSLNGKIVIVDRASYKSNVIDIYFDDFANISLLEKINNNIIVATNNRIVLVAPNYTYSIDIKNNFIRLIDDKLYILAEDGNIYLYDKNLKKITNKKFAFSTLMGLVKKDENIFILEEQGFLIKTDLALDKKKIFNIVFDKESAVYFGDSNIYFNDTYFSGDK